METIQTVHAGWLLRPRGEARMINPTRRKLIGGIGLLFAAPAIVKASSLMPVKVYKAPMFIAADWAFAESYSAVFQTRLS